MAQYAILAISTNTIAHMVRKAGFKQAIVKYGSEPSKINKMTFCVFLKQIFLGYT